MTTYKTIAVAGATGKLGPTLVDALVAAGFDVTILSRAGSTHQNKSSVVKTVPVDYGSIESLTDALKGKDVLVSNLPNHGGQKPLIDAAIAAQVKRILPSEFGSDVYGNSKTAALPGFRTGKTEIQKYLREKGDSISWTIIVTGLFLDWGLSSGLFVNLKGPTRLFDGGDTRFSTSILSDIGKAVVGVLQHPEETKNRAVYIQSASVTQNELLRIAKELKPDFPATTEPITSIQLEQDAHHKLESGNVMSAMMDFILVTVFGEGYGTYWDSKNDNALLGVNGLSRDELKELLARNM